MMMSNFAEQARIVPDEFDDGWVLEINGDVQSHVDPNRPTLIRYEYLRRIGNVLDACWSPNQPIRALHLGAGALTLPRYLQATRPGSTQTVVEFEPDLIPLVTSELPLPAGTDLTVLTGDARSELQAMEGQHFDAIVLDIFTGANTAAHLTGEDFYRELLGRLSERGVLLVNIGDDDGLQFFAQQARALNNVAQDAGYRGAWTLAEASILACRISGNAVLAAGAGLPTDDDQIEALRSRLSAAGPHPASTLAPSDTTSLTKTLRHMS